MCGRGSTVGVVMEGDTCYRRYDVWGMVVGVVLGGTVCERVGRTEGRTEGSAVGVVWC